MQLEEILICCKKLDNFLANGWIVTQDHIVVSEVGCCSDRFKLEVEAARKHRPFKFMNVINSSLWQLNVSGIPTKHQIRKNFRIIQSRSCWINGQIVISNIFRRPSMFKSSHICYSVWSRDMIESTSEQRVDDPNEHHQTTEQRAQFSYVSREKVGEKCRGTCPLKCISILLCKTLANPFVLSAT